MFQTLEDQIEEYEGLGRGMIVGLSLLDLLIGSFREQVSKHKEGGEMKKVVSPVRGFGWFMAGIILVALIQYYWISSVSSDYYSNIFQWVFWLGLAGIFPFLRRAMHNSDLFWGVYGLVATFSLALYHILPRFIVFTLSWVFHLSYNTWLLNAYQLFASLLPVLMGALVIRELGHQSIRKIWRQYQQFFQDEPNLIWKKFVFLWLSLMVVALVAYWIALPTLSGLDGGHFYHYYFLENGNFVSFVLYILMCVGSVGMASVLYVLCGKKIWPALIVTWLVWGIFGGGYYGSQIGLGNRPQEVEISESQAVALQESCALLDTEGSGQTLEAVRQNYHLSGPAPVGATSALCLSYMDPNHPIIQNGLMMQKTVGYYENMGDSTKHYTQTGYSLPFWGDDMGQLDIYWVGLFVSGSLILLPGLVSLLLAWLVVRSKL